MNGAMEFFIPGICGMGLNFRLDGFRLVYAGIAVLMWTVSGIFSQEYMAHYKNKGRYYAFFWATFVATVGVFLSADLYTTFIFFEIMSFTSYVWVAFDEKKESLKAAETYLAVAVIGGLVMLMGLFLLNDLLGTLRMDEIGGAAKAVLEHGGAAGEGGRYLSPAAQLYLSGGLLLFGFGAKAGCFPLHIWLPKAHPVAPAPASALLSGILTKAGVFGIIIVSCLLFETDGLWGLLIAGLGLITMFTGALLALFSVNLKRTLACSSISQIGFILTGIGMACLLKNAGGGNALAVRGAFLHMVNHSLFKLVLFLCAGVVYMNLHELDLNQVRGFGRKKPALCFCFSMGALGISGVPLFSGYISKTLLHESIVEYGELVYEGASVTLSSGLSAAAADAMGGFLHWAASPAVWTAAEWVFLLTGGMTAAYMLKLFIALFVEKNPLKQAEYDQLSDSYMNRKSRFVIVAVSVLLPILGTLPHLTMDRLADLGRPFFAGDGLEAAVSYFSPGNLKGSAVSIGIGVVLYVAVVRGLLMESDGSGGRRYRNCWPSWLDLENLIYRPVLEHLLPGVCGAVCSFVDRYLVSTAVTVFLAVSSVACRAMDHMADGLILLARKTTHRQVREKKAVQEKDWPLAEELCHTGRLVEESFSFGLMLFGIGLCLTLGYLLFVFMRG